MNIFDAEIVWMVFVNEQFAAMYAEFSQAQKMQKVIMENPKTISVIHRYERTHCGD